MLGFVNAQHEETAPHASQLVISRLVCSLAGKREKVMISTGTRVHQAYGREETVEEFRCNYGLNPAYRDQFSDGLLREAGVDSDGECRIVELANHPFFVGTLFLPQLSSSATNPHPLIVAYVKAAHYSHADR